MSIDFTSITGSADYILSGSRYTLELTAITAVGGLALGTALALCRLSRNKFLSNFSRFYTNLMRAVPLVLILFWFFLLMPEVLKVILGLDHPVMIGADLTAIITFVLFEAAYFSEIMRAGIQSVSKGQLSAAKALGLRYGQTMRYIVLPQAVRDALGIMIYGMFLAIILPPCRKSKQITAVVACASLLSCLSALLQTYVPISSGFVIIICTVAAASLGAWLFPVQEENT